MISIAIDFHLLRLFRVMSCRLKLEQTQFPLWRLEIDFNSHHRHHKQSIFDIAQNKFESKGEL